MWIMIGGALHWGLGWNFLKEENSTNVYSFEKEKKNRGILNEIYL